MSRFVPPLRLKSCGTLSSISKERIVCGEVFVTVKVTLTSSPATERVGRNFLLIEIGTGLALGSEVGTNSKTAIGSTKRVSQGVLRPRLRKMKAYAITRYPRALLVSEVSLPSERGPCVRFPQLLKPGRTRVPMKLPWGLFCVRGPHCKWPSHRRVICNLFRTRRHWPGLA